MANKTFTDGVYDTTALKTTVSNLSLSGANNTVVLVTPGDVTDLGVYGLLYTDTGGPYGAQREVTVENAGDNTVFTTTLSADNTEMAIVDAKGTTITFTLSDSTVTTVHTPDAVNSVKAVGPEHRRKHLLGY